MREFTYRCRETGRLVGNLIGTREEAEMNCPADREVVEGRLPVEEYRPPSTYAELRRAAYPPLTDLADALYWRERGQLGPWRAYVARVDAVKTAIPKP